jgi:hypothetical protein
MIKDYGLHIQFQLIKKPQEHRVDLIFSKLLALIKIEIILDKAPNLFLDGLSPAELGDLVEILRHQFLSKHKFVMMQWKLIDLGIKLLLIDLLELFAVLCQQQIDIERVSIQLVSSYGPLGH